MTPTDEKPIVPGWLILTIMAAWLVFLCMLSGCMTPEAIDLKRRNPDIRLLWYKGRLVYMKCADPYNVPLEIVRQMREDEYRIWMERLRELSKRKGSE